MAGKSRVKVHLDAREAGDVVARALCGWIAVETDADISRVTCARCIAKHTRGMVTGRELGTLAASLGDGLRSVSSAVEHLFGKTAGPPPRMDAAAWSASCKGAPDHVRCGNCPLCVWEREAERWLDTRRWDVEHVTGPRDGVPRWSSLVSALRALLAYGQHDRNAPSAFGAVLDRCRRGDMMGGGNDSKGEDPLMRRAGDVMPVWLAVERAFPERWHGVLTSTACVSVFLLRTRGLIEGEMPSYEALAVEHGISIGDLKSIVKRGRSFVTVELAARGLIPMPRAEEGLAEEVERCMERLASHG